MDSEPNLSVKWSISIDTMLNHDGDFDGQGHGDTTCKRGPCGLTIQASSWTIVISWTIAIL